MTGNSDKRAFIKAVVDRLVRDYTPKRVILFGSYAYGTPTEESDIDLLIIKNTECSPLDRWTEVRRILRTESPESPVSPLIYTEKEIESRRAIRDLFLEEILEKGEVLYG